MSKYASGLAIAMKSDDFVDPYMDPETGLKELLNRAMGPFPRRQGEKAVETNVAQRLLLSRGRAPAKVSPIEKNLARRIEREERGRE